MTNKVCSKCKQELPLSSFGRRGDGLLGHCKSCEANRTKEYRTKRKKEIIDSFGNKCHDCGGTFHPAIYQFHHLDSSKKDVNITKLLHSKQEILQKELDKCIMLCANCHCMRHYE